MRIRFSPRWREMVGHGAGDELLRAFARRLAAAVRPGDEEAERVTDHVHLLLKHPLHVLTHEVVVTASTGIALHRSATESAADYVRNAELAMQEAKSLGEMMVWYQPVFSARAGAATRMVGLEALVRWRHPTRGLLGPGEFIPLAEETGMIVPLGTWVLGEACRHMMELAPNGPTAPWVSVNLAAKQLMDGTLVEIVERADGREHRVSRECALRGHAGQESLDGRGGRRRGARGAARATTHDGMRARTGIPAVASVAS